MDRGLRGIFETSALAAMVIALWLSPEVARAEPSSVTGAVSNKAPWGCFRGKPLPACRGMFLEEARVGYAFAHFPESQHFDGQPGVVEVAAGYLWNLDEKQALGGVAFVETGGSTLARVTVRTGLRLRYRLWLNDLIALDASPGIVVTGSNPLGFSGDLALNLGDLVAPYVEVEALRGANPSGGAAVGANGQLVNDPPFHSATVVSAGLRFGSFASAIIACALLVALPVAVNIAGNRRAD